MDAHHPLSEPPIDNGEELENFLESPPKSPSQTNKIHHVGDIIVDPSTGYVVHTVNKDDTLQRVAILYNVKAQEVKKLNKLWSDQIFPKPSILIPLQAAEFKKLVELRKKNVRTGAKAC